MSSSTFNIEKLDGTNYEAWRKAAWAILYGNGHEEFLTGEAVVSDFEDATAFRAAGRKAHRTLVSTINYSQMGLVREGETAKDLWTRLESTFRPKGFSARFEMRRGFFRMKMQPSESMSAWITRVENAVERLKGIGAVIPDDDILVVLMEGLPQEYAGIITALDTVDEDVLKLPYVKARLGNAYTRINNNTPGEDIYFHDEARANAAWKNRLGAPGRGSTPGTARRAPARKPAGMPSSRTNTSTLDCHRCGLSGHISAKCMIILDGDRYMTDEEMHSLRGAAAGAIPSELTEDDGEWGSGVAGGALGTASAMDIEEMGADEGFSFLQPLRG